MRKKVLKWIFLTSLPLLSGCSDSSSSWSLFEHNEIHGNGSSLDVRYFNGSPFELRDYFSWEKSRPLQTWLELKDARTIWLGKGANSSTAIIDPPKMVFERFSSFSFQIPFQDVQRALLQSNIQDSSIQFRVVTNIDGVNFKTPWCQVVHMESDVQRTLMCEGEGKPREFGESGRIDALHE